MLIITILLFLLNFPSSLSPPVSSPSRLPKNSSPTRTYVVPLQILNSSDYGDFDPKEGHWLDLDGFRESDSYKWELLSTARSRAKDQVRMVFGMQDGLRVLESSPKSSWFSLIAPHLYENVSGYARGKWSLLVSAGDTTKIGPGNSTQGDRDKTAFLQRNVIGESGEIHFDFLEKNPFDLWDGTSVRGISADITLYQTEPEQSWAFSMEGLHILETGTSLMVTSSSKLVCSILLSMF
jgi:transmembrane E3 ubiquitin-protein ligase